MRFVDEATIEITAGNGGKGCVSFLRERFRPKGGPDGGDGGKGGDVLIRVNPSRATLADYSYLRHLKAENGVHGQGSDKNGRAGKDKIIEVPAGTLVRDVDTKEILADLTENGQEVIAAHGGKGGKGNRHFASPTNRAPRYAQPGLPGEKRTIMLELKLLADVGLVGLPNAGKSSLVSAASKATPKVADYPFTTLTPHLGMVRASKGEPFALADIPGLVEGAHKGAGLGLRFLKHVERTRLFIYVVDLSSEDPTLDLATIRAELAAYDPELAARAALVCANKLDLDNAREALAGFKEHVDGLGLTLMQTSALTGTGVKALIEAISEHLIDQDKPESFEAEE